MIQKKSLKDAIQNPEIISVVGELFNQQQLYPMMRRIGNDFNKAVTPGWYYIDGKSATNLPPGAYSYGCLFVFGSPNIYERLVQLYISDQLSNGFYFRIANSNLGPLTEITTEWYKGQLSKVG